MMNIDHGERLHLLEQTCHRRVQIFLAVLMYAEFDSAMSFRPTLLDLYYQQHVSQMLLTIAAQNLIIMLALLAGTEVQFITVFSPRAFTNLNYASVTYLVLYRYLLAPP